MGAMRGSPRNTMATADANADSLLDRVTDYKSHQRIEVAVRPGNEADPRCSWPTLAAWVAEPDLLAGWISEHARVGDLAGDGRLDIVVAQGHSGLLGLAGGPPRICTLWEKTGIRPRPVERW